MQHAYIHAHLHSRLLQTVDESSCTYLSLFAYNSDSLCFIAQKHTLLKSIITYRTLNPTAVYIVDLSFLKPSPFLASLILSSYVILLWLFFLIFSSLSFLVLLNLICKIKFSLFQFFFQNKHHSCHWIHLLFLSALSHINTLAQLCPLSFIPMYLYFFKKVSLKSRFTLKLTSSKENS